MMITTKMTTSFVLSVILMAMLLGHDHLVAVAQEENTLAPSSFPLFVCVRT